MASRKGLYFRGGIREEEDRLEKVRAETAQRVSTKSSATPTSKIPLFHSSMFSRGNRSRTDVGGASSKTVEYPTLRKPQGRPVGGPFSKQETSGTDMPTASRNIGLGIQTAHIPRGVLSPQSKGGRPDGRPKNVLRRKASSVDQHAQYASTASTSFSDISTSFRPSREITSSPGGYTDPFPGSMLGISMPSVSASSSIVQGVRAAVSEESTSSSRMANYMSSGQPQKISATNLPRPAGGFPAHSSSPSTLYSESPGPFSRTSTPTSMSSHSPGIVLAPSKSASRQNQPSPTRSRPPITRRRLGGTAHQDSLDVARTQGLPALRESLTSSSSSSTVKGVDRAEATEASKGHSMSRLSPPPPSPPLRKPSRLDRKTSLENDAVGGRFEATNTTGLYDLDASRVSTASEQRINTPPQVSTQRRAPPRPSREGTPRLDDNGPSPVIQSNLSRLVTTGHKRRESMEKGTPIHTVGKDMVYPEFASLVRSSTNASTSSRRPTVVLSPNLGKVTQGPSQDSQGLRERPTPPLQTDTTSGHAKREPSPLGAILCKSPSRFGIFSRHKKVPPESSDFETGERASKKGPAAGTGHEGYGKYARRGRSGSVATKASRNRSTSANSNTTGATTTSFSRKSSVSSRGGFEIDEFYRERLSPVVIPGGAGIFGDRCSTSENYGSKSGDSSSGLASSVDPRKESQATVIRGNSIGNVSTNATSERRGSRSLPQERDILARMEHIRYVPHMDNPSKIPTLATRRSLHRSQAFKEAEPFQKLPPINTRAIVTLPPRESHDTMQSSKPQTGNSSYLTEDISEGREGAWLKSRKTTKGTASPMKWNFFQRAHAPLPVVRHNNFYDDVNSPQKLPVTISRLPEARSIAHYAMIDEKDQPDPATLEDLLQVVEDGTKSLEKEDPWYHSESAEHAQSREHTISLLLPSPPDFMKEFTKQSRPASPAVPLYPGEALRVQSPVSQPLPEPEQPRLRQVGRIPRVISKRDRLHKPPPQSFSRPFARTPVMESDPSARTEFPTVQRPVLGVQTDFIPSRPFGVAESAKPASAPVVATEPFSPADSREFLVFPPRVGSEVSASSSSGILSSTATTAVLPQPDATLSEDEVWDEYDELLDSVGSSSSSKAPKTAVNASKSYLSGESKERGLEKPARGAMEKGVPVLGTQESRRDPLPPLPLHLRTPAPVVASPSPPTSSRLFTPIRSPTLLPSTPMSFSEVFASYGDRSSASTKDQPQSDLSASHYSTDSIHSTPTPIRSGQNQNMQLLARKTSNGSNAQSNLRFSALMVSRWLSFGRVLFSPAHTEIHHSPQNRVLVLDGLGNDDWSFYCALTYPSAIVYNLSAFQPAPTTARNSYPASAPPPSNHRQIHHASIAHPFPFPRGFFTAAVVRFPIASSDPAYRNAISECKRVLRPGGYLELSVLDIDMLNMGNRARRAVRALKLRMQAQDPNVSLQPASDSIQKLLGRRGFENLNRCMVGVPVAGMVSDSRAGSFDEEAGGSLADLLRDESGKGDVGITKMVAKVGRWWYTRCYEMAVLQAETDAEAEQERRGEEEGSEREREKEMVGSIGADRALLKECERRETGFKLLICYAQKPVAARRRTVSV
ncbi:MAG: hypothetical protein LQ347_004762 [Umbilicaria vellea]|nr:MAG: hypothetical protein LQ347_004762 [Umbilicaria vellea]